MDLALTYIALSSFVFGFLTLLYLGLKTIKLI